MYKTLCCLLALVAVAAASPVDRLALLDNERASLTSLSVEAQVETPKSNNRWARFPMTFTYQAPNKYRSEIKTGGFEGDMIIVADGAEIWTYLTKKKEVTRVDQAAATAAIKSQGPSDVLTVLATPSLRFADLFDVADASQESDTWTLTLTPKIAVKAYDKIILKTDAAGTTPLYAEAYDNGKITARVYFNTYTRNPQVDANAFVFVVPDGVKVK